MIGFPFLLSLKFSILNFCKRLKNRSLNHLKKESSIVSSLFPFLKKEHYFRVQFSDETHLLKL